jgi:hypothetical protein
MPILKCLDYLLTVMGNGRPVIDVGSGNDAAETKAAVDKIGFNVIAFELLPAILPASRTCMPLIRTFALFPWKVMSRVDGVGQQALILQHLLTVEALHTLFTLALDQKMV